MTPAVSVVITCFNLGAFLDEAVQSVLDQTYRDFEILIVDDGSDDEATRHLLASYRRPHTRVIRAPHGGRPAIPRNIGLLESRARYVSFLDADDVFEPRFLEATIGRLEQDDSISFAGTWVRGFGEREFAWEPEHCDLPCLLAEDTVCTPAPARREALVGVGGVDEDPRVAGQEDWALAIALVDAGHRGTVVPEHLFRYRIRAGSVSSWSTGPEHLERTFRYLLGKHEATYREHAAGVADVIRARTAQLERLLGADDAEAPAFDDGRWSESLVELELYRKLLEDLSEQRGSGAAVAPTDHDIAWGSLRRLEPVSRVWGLDRGLPVDRHYIETFLAEHAHQITGDVLEVKDPHYTMRFSRDARSVTTVDIAEQNPDATLIADLSKPGVLPANRYDCAIVTQTIHLIYEIDEVVRNLHAGLAPGGVLLATLPCVTRIDNESGVEQDFWRFTAASARRLVAACFGEEAVQVEVFGNLLACTAFLQGMAAGDLSPEELEHRDPYFPLLIGVRAVKSPLAGAPTERHRDVRGHVDLAACDAIGGWAWDAAAPEQRLRVRIFDREREIGSAWALAPRADLAEAGIGGGRVAFHHSPSVDLHGDPPAEIRVSAGEVDLSGSPRAVECRCRDDATSQQELLGAALDIPASAMIGTTEIEVVGWVLGRSEPVRELELCDGDQPFRRIVVDAPRPDIAEAFPDVEWAGRAGFHERVSLLGAPDGLVLQVRAVIPSGQRAIVGKAVVPARAADGPPVVVVLESAHLDRAGSAPLAQDRPAAHVLVREGPQPAGHPRFRSVGTLGRALDDPEAIVWIPGDDPVPPEFLSQAVVALTNRPEASFAVATVQAHDPGPDIVGALSGTAAGAAVVFRASAARIAGGLDDAAPSPEAAAWDLVVRLTEAGHKMVTVPISGDPHGLAERAGSEGARWVYRKHARLFQTSLADVLLDRERALGDLLRGNHLLERSLEAEQRPALAARRRERDRLAAKLRTSWPSRQDERWGDLRRLEPFSPLYGSERGLCVDRRYIEDFLERNADAIHGDVLECHNAIYTHRYGGSAVRKVDVLDIERGNPNATVLADLRRAPELADGSYDCVILTQVLNVVDDVDAALSETARILRPGGTLLLTVPTVARSDPEAGPDGDSWRFSPAGLNQLLRRYFGADGVKVKGEGRRRDVLGFLAGLSADESDDPAGGGGPLVVTARAVKSTGSAAL